MTRVPADPARMVKDFLSVQLPAVAGVPAPTVALMLPSSWSPSSAPAVVVFDDGGGATWPVRTTPLLRITVWAAGRTAARRLAGLALGLLMDREIPGVANVLEPSSMLEDVDENGGFMASFTVRAIARTITV